MFSKFNTAVVTFLVLAEAITLKEKTYDDGNNNNTVSKGNNVNIEINFCLNVGDAEDCPDSTEDADDDSDSEGVDIAINGEELISDGEVVDEETGAGEMEMGGDMEDLVDCTEICEAYELCSLDANASLMRAEEGFDNTATVSMLFSLQTNIFMTEE